MSDSEGEEYSNNEKELNQTQKKIHDKEIAKFFNKHKVTILHELDLMLKEQEILNVRLELNQEKYEKLQKALALKNLDIYFNKEKNSQKSSQNQTQEKSKKRKLEDLKAQNHHSKNTNKSAEPSSLKNKCTSKCQRKIINYYNNYNYYYNQSQ